MGNIGSSSTKRREFDISGLKLKLDTASDVSDYVKELNKAKGLEVVNLSGNTLGLEACQALAAALEGHLTLQEINLSDCFTGRLKEHVPPSIEAFGKVLAEKPNLRIIDFSDNAFSPAGATALSYFLANCTSLEDLRLNNNGLGPEGGKIIANGLKENRRKSQAAGKPSVLRRVTIGRNRLENGSSNELAEAFSLHENLEEAALFQNGIRPEGIVALAQGLSKCLKLKSLDLQDNTFSEKGSMAISSAIPLWNELTRLNAGDCLLGDAGSKAIIQNLISSPCASKLTVLNLQYAELESETAEYLAQNLKSFSSLEKLFLNGNCFAPEGKEAKSIKAALHPTTTLDELDDMEYESEDESESEEESESEAEVEETTKIDQIPSTPSPEMVVDEVKDVTEIIGAMAIKETEEMVPEAAESVESEVVESEAVEANITESVESEVAEIENKTVESEITESVESEAAEIIDTKTILVPEIESEVTEVIDITEIAAEATQITEVVGTTVIDTEVTETVIEEHIEATVVETEDTEAASVESSVNVPAELTETPVNSD